MPPGRIRPALGPEYQDKINRKIKRIFDKGLPVLALERVFVSPRDVCFAGTNEIEVRSSRWRDLSMKPDCGSLVYWILRSKIPS